MDASQCNGLNDLHDLDLDEAVVDEVAWLCLSDLDDELLLMCLLKLLRCCCRCELLSAAAPPSCCDEPLPCEIPELLTGLDTEGRGPRLPSRRLLLLLEDLQIHSYNPQ